MKTSLPLEGKEKKKTYILREKFGGEKENMGGSFS